MTYTVRIPKLPSVLRFKIIKYASERNIGFGEALVELLKKATYPLAGETTFMV